MAAMTLVVVRCPACGNPLTPDDNDLVIACGQCGAGLHLADEGPEPIEIQYARTNLVKVNFWRPWWIFTGSVNLIKRETQGGNRSEEARQFWAQPRVMGVPAWDLSLTSVKQTGCADVETSTRVNSCPAPRRRQADPGGCLGRRCAQDAGVFDPHAGSRPRRLAQDARLSDRGRPAGVVGDCDGVSASLRAEAVSRRSNLHARRPPTPIPNTSNHARE